MTVPSDKNVDVVMDGFDTACSTSTVSDGVVTERGPGAGSRQHGVSAGSDVRLGRS